MPIHSNFLLQSRVSVGMTLLIPAYPLAEACDRIDRVAKNGYHDIDFYACNIGDNPFKQSHHETDAAVDAAPLLACCAHAKQLGLRVTLWGFADDSNWRMTEAIQKQEKFLPLLAPHIARYIPALEGNETFGVSGVNSLVVAARALFSVPIYLHWNRGINTGFTWNDVRGIYYQYASRTPVGVEAETRDCVAPWHTAGHQFIAGEFHDTLTPAEAQACGDAAIRGGADGSACGASA